MAVNERFMTYSLIQQPRERALAPIERACSTPASSLAPRDYAEEFTTGLLPAATRLIRDARLGQYSAE